MQAERWPTASSARSQRLDPDRSSLNRPVSDGLGASELVCAEARKITGDRAFQSGKRRSGCDRLGSSPTSAQTPEQPRHECITHPEPIDDCCRQHGVLAGDPFGDENAALLAPGQNDDGGTRCPSSANVSAAATPADRLRRPSGRRARCIPRLGRGDHRRQRLSAPPRRPQLRPVIDVDANPRSDLSGSTQERAREPPARSPSAGVIPDTSAYSAPSSTVASTCPSR